MKSSFALTRIVPMHVICDEHGEQGVGLVCVHVACAMESDASPGCYRSSPTDLARPDAWCQACETALLRDGWSETWFAAAAFKIFCAGCWDLAWRRYGIGPSACREV
jgi:hypothetical protein